MACPLPPGAVRVSLLPFLQGGTYAILTAAAGGEGSDATGPSPAVQSRAVKEEPVDVAGAEDAAAASAAARAEATAAGAQVSRCDAAIADASFRWACKGEGC